MTARRGWSLPEHLALDALVAFVDGELSPSAYDRAAAHLAHCSACSAEAAAQRQARAAVRGADTPHVPPGLLQALESIPDETGLADQPDELAVTEDGQLVTAERHATKSGSAAEASRTTTAAREEAPDGAAHSGSATGRRARQGAGIMVSGLVLGALAFMNVPSDDLRIPEPNPLPPPGGEHAGTGGAPATAATNAVQPAASPPLPAPPAALQQDGSARPTAPPPPSAPEPPAMLAGSPPS